MKSPVAAVTLSVVLRVVLLLPLLSGLGLLRPAPSSAQEAAPVWTAIAATGPAARWDHTLAADPETGRLILFGGCSSGFGPCPQGDLWSFDPATRTWTELTPASAPAARSNPALIRDDASGSIWLIDGLTEAGDVADLWTLAADGDTPSWSELAQSATVPQPRASHDAAVLDGDVYLFGGYGDAGPLADLWVRQPSAYPDEVLWHAVS